MTNKELQEILKKMPDDAPVVVEYCDPKSIRYHADAHIITID